MRIAAVDIGGTALKYCVCGSAAGLDRSQVRESPNLAGRGVSVPAQLTQLLGGLGAFDAIAVCTAGQVNPETGTILYATDNIPGYSNTPLKALLQEAFAVPVLVLNDVDAAAVGEGIFGAGETFSDFLCLTYGTGIGGAIVIDRNLYYGSSFKAGEMGHIVTHAGGLPCTCGNRGCYEAYASTTALARMVREATGLSLDGRSIFARADSDPRIAGALTGWMDEVLLGLASLIHVFNPPCVILGGGVMSEPRVLEYIHRNIYSHLMPSFWATEIRSAVLGNCAGMMGAAALLERQMKWKRGDPD